MQNVMTLEREAMNSACLLEMQEAVLLVVLLVFRAKLKLLLFEEERERERWNKEVVHDLATLCLLLCGYIHRA